MTTKNAKSAEKPASPPLSSSDLFGCPFCGSHNLLQACRYGFPVAVECKDCGATGPYKLTGPEADAAWNEARCRREIRKLEETIDNLNQGWIDDNI